jgi:hypothetical protein
MDQLRDLVMTVWDPIGVHVPEDSTEDRALYWGEYDNYPPTIMARLDAGDDIDWLISYLAHVSTKLMRLSPNPDHDRHAAQTIVDWHQRTPDPLTRSATRDETPDRRRQPTFFDGDRPTVFDGA